MAARLLVAAAAAVAMAMAEDGVPSCATTGTGFNDPLRNNTPNGGSWLTANECQATCQRTVFCEHFTWYKDSNACWLQGNNYTLLQHKDAISGPQSCPTNETSTTAVVFVPPAAAVTDLTPVPNGTEVPTVTEAPTTSSTQEAVAKAIAGATKGTAGTTGEPDESGGFPWWGYLLIAAGVVLIGVIAFLMLCCGGGDGKKRSKKKTSKSSKSSAARDMEAAEDRQPLMQTPAVPTPVPVLAPAAAAPTTYTSGGAASVAYQSGGQVVMGGSPVAAPVASYQMVSPVAMAQPTYVSGRSVAAAPAMMSVAAPPVASYVIGQQPAAPMAAHDLFTQLDTNNDGVLDAQELAAMGRR